MLKFPSINLYLHHDNKSSKPELVIYIFVRSEGKTFTYNTGARINPIYWNVKKQEVKTNYIGSPEFNNLLNNYRSRIKDTITDFLNTNSEWNFDKLKIELKKKFNEKEKSNGFFEMLDLFIDVRKNELQENSLKKFRTLKKHLLAFQEKEKIKLSYDNIDLSFFDKFKDYLINDLKHTNNTIHKTVGFLKIFLNWSSERNYNKNNEYLKFKQKSNSVDAVSLTELELIMLMNLDLKDKLSLEKIRDIFCFSCFTGQRFSDVSSIKREDIKGNTWYLRTKKTKDIITIPLTEPPILILSKYLDNLKPLPTISMQKTNDYLKELCKLAGIDDSFYIVKYRGAERIEEKFKKYELIGTHTARRTFVTLSLEKGMRPETLMEITGHKDYKTFKKYIKITDTVKQVEMNNIWKSDGGLKLVINN